MTDQTIIIVEDEDKIAQILVDYLAKDGFKTHVLNDGTHAVETIKAGSPAFVILDLMLPGKDGLSICREVRQFSSVPILMLTARVDEIDRLLGLEMGADDYVCKPFLPREVVARVRTILRRVNQHPVSSAHEKIEYRGISLFPERFLCKVGDEELDLTPVEFRMLKTLLSQPGRVYSREILIRSSYKDDRIVSDRTIDSHIKNLRKKLSRALGDEEVIHSTYGVGYKIE
ncbi:response regulator [Marinobacter sp. ANT_B65]|uniref:response regulator n=1 Tax=Marinobacter sp. ANT_B65 TaxID=2039467 RepID=UPI000BBE9157|nr:response regulator [Marinobacter sp. ANT_B65]PCM45573.1 two-component system response regulator BaeR [Marinobacter sp. ANT_B65]